MLPFRNTPRSSLGALVPPVPIVPFFIHRIQSGWIRKHVTLSLVILLARSTNQRPMSYVFNWDTTFLLRLAASYVALIRASNRSLRNGCQYADAGCGEQQFGKLTHDRFQSQPAPVCDATIRRRRKVGHY